MQFFVRWYRALRLARARRRRTRELLAQRGWFTASNQSGCTCDFCRERLVSVDARTEPVVSPRGERFLGKHIDVGAACLRCGVLYPRGGPGYSLEGNEQRETP